MKIKSWLKRITTGLLIVVVLVLFTGFVFERISRNRAEKIQPDGAFATVSDHQLHYLRKGKQGPTVIFETGFDPSGHLQWLHFQQDTLPYSTLSYDRAGILWSERGTNIKSGEKIAEELHSLLERVGASRPYIYVGHSFGGMLARFFVKKYPGELGGVILVDSKCPTDKDYLSAELYTMVNQGMPDKLLKFANTFGIARLLFGNMFPKEEQFRFQNKVMPALIHRSAYAVLEEQAGMEAMKNEAALIQSFDSIPLCIITATNENRYDSFIKDPALRKEMITAWGKMQKDLLKLSTKSRQILVANSGHYVHIDNPAIVKDAISRMANEISKR